MNMDDLFAMGFCKAAEEHGVDPAQLAKFAAEIIPLEQTERMFNNAKPPKIQDKSVADVYQDAARRMYHKIWENNYAEADRMRGLGAGAIIDRFMPRGSSERRLYDWLSRAGTLTNPKLTVFDAIKDPKVAQNVSDMITMSEMKSRMAHGESPWDLMSQIGAPVQGRIEPFPEAVARRGEVSKILKSYGYPKPTNALPAAAKAAPAAAKAAPAATRAGMISRIAKLFGRR